MRCSARRNMAHRRVGIRWWLFLGLAVFTILIMVVLWVFQIRLLGYFYEQEKFSEMEKITADLAKSVGTENFQSQVEAYAHDNGTCIQVFCVEDGLGGAGEKRAIKVADAEVANDCIIHHLPPEQISRIYDDAKANGGTYDQRMELQDAFAEENAQFRVPGFHQRGTVINAIHARLLQYDGTEYLLMLDVQLTPVSAIVNTLEVQFLWIALALLLVAFLVAFFASHMIARPLIAITEKAQGLAKGNYEPDFSGKGYREVQELADTLNFAATEIGVTDRLQKELIANVSHDLRTPLTMIRGYSEMMRDIPGENSPENVQAIIDETTRLSELVSDLMDLSKLQAGTRKLSFSVFNLTAVLRDVMQRYDTLMRHEGYRIELQTAGDAYVRADRTMILQVIYNLINNAVNYTGDSKRVTVTQTLKEGKVHFAVADDGEGIPPEQIAEIWDRYYRVDKVHKRSVMGTGLGLSIVKGALEAHGATYGVNSAVGVGSVFWFELPLAEPAEEAL